MPQSESSHVSSSSDAVEPQDDESADIDESSNIEEDFVSSPNIRDSDEHDTGISDEEITEPGSIYGLEQKVYNTKDESNKRVTFAIDESEEPLIGDCNNRDTSMDARDVDDWPDKDDQEDDVDSFIKIEPSLEHDDRDDMTNDNIIFQAWARVFFQSRKDPMESQLTSENLTSSSAYRHTYLYVTINSEITHLRIYSSEAMEQLVVDPPIDLKYFYAVRVSGVHTR